jgi:hypothetical protein
MSLVRGSRFAVIGVAIGTILISGARAGWAQETQPPATIPPAGTASQQESGGRPVIVHTPEPPQDPLILEDGGISITPFYWFSSSQPTLRGGKAAPVDTFENLDYPGKSNRPLGGEIAFPAGRANSLRISYFRLQGNANSTLARDTTIFSEAYLTGDYVAANYLIQGAKISWDYLSYTWHKPRTNIHFKTLYELQFINAGTNVVAPFKAITTDASGNTDTNTAHGTKSLVYPTFGGELESALGKRFRWEIKGSGFGIPHRGNIWDAQATIAMRVGPMEFLGGEKAVHFKMSPQSEQYFLNTLSGAYVGVRYYWGHEEQ